MRKADFRGTWNTGNWSYYVGVDPNQVLDTRIPLYERPSQQSVCHKDSFIHILKCGLRRDDLGLKIGEILLGGFLRRLRNQKFTGEPNVMQSKINSTINQQKGRVKIRLVASKRNETNVTIVISNSLATALIKQTPKRASLNILCLLYNGISLDHCSILAPCRSSA